MSISRVYPCFNYLRSSLVDNPSKYKFTTQLRKDLYTSLITRFENLVDQDLFKLSTLLDPNFGIYAFEISMHADIKQLLKKQMKSLDSESTTIEEVSAARPIAQLRTNNYVFYKTQNVNLNENVDNFDLTIDTYCNLVGSGDYKDALDFWRLNEQKFPELSKLAKKFLGVQASSASVERMFNFAGHIFSNKRRRTGVKLFENLVFLKLNE